MLQIQYILLIIFSFLIVSIAVCCGIMAVHKSTQWNMGVVRTSRVYPFTTSSVNSQNDTKSDRQQLLSLAAPEGNIITTFENPILNNHINHSNYQDNTILYMEDDY